jgi:hypothetical protein
MKKTLFFLFIFISSCFASTQSQDLPIVSGKIFYQMQADRILNSKAINTNQTNGFLYVEPTISFNINNNWSIKNQLRFQPNNTLTTRDKENPERYRTFLNQDRSVNINHNGLLVEEIKLQYENEDMRVSLGKFDPTFGTAHRRSKRIGVFTSQFSEDYNLREKLGFNIVALLEDAQLSLSSFFNDNTNLSNSAIDKRGVDLRSNGLAGSTKSFSSYSLSLEGDNLFAFKDWFYHFGYRSLATKDYIINKLYRDREQGVVLSSEYKYKLGKKTSLIPFAEAVYMKNSSGIKDRNNSYVTTALIGQYSSWTASGSYSLRNIRNKQINNNKTDKQLQFSVGYKFDNNIALDLSRAKIIENNKKGVLVGANLTYLQEF